MKLLREPLLHFLLLGSALFAAQAWLERGNPAPAPGPKPVRIDVTDVQWLEESWRRQWLRDPTPEELRGLVTGFLREELLAREAREMGLDQHDTYVRRWLAQKVQFLVQDTTRLAEPTEDALQEYYATHRERFGEEARVSFRHVYFSPQSREKIVPALSRLESGDDATKFGEPLLVEPEFHEATEQTVAGQFGGEFARAVFALPTGSWQGPIGSGYGFHLVQVSALKPARRKAFSEVRDQVLEACRQERQQAENEKYYASLLKKYDVAADESVKPLLGPLVEPAR